MSIKSYILFAAIFFFTCTLHSRASVLTKDTLSASAFKPYGRYLINKQNECELISSAAHFGFRFKANQCAIYFSNAADKGNNYIQYELDGVYQKRMLIPAKEPIIIKANTDGWHTVWIYKATEPHTGSVTISKIVRKALCPFHLRKQHRLNL